MTTPTHILLADDQPALCSALRLLLEQEPAWRVVGEAPDAHHLLTQLDATRPDLVLLDWELPGLHIEKLLPLLRRRLPTLQIIALSSHPEARHASLSLGVDAFVSKGDPPDYLLTTLHLLCARQPPLSQECPARLPQNLSSP